MFEHEITEVFYDANKIKWREYCYSNMQHRQYGPAYQEWYSSGQLRWEEWSINGKLHRTNGPAYRVWHENDTLYQNMFFLYGIQLTVKHRKWAKSVGISDIMAMTPEEFTLFKLSWGNDV